MKVEGRRVLDRRRAPLPPVRTGQRWRREPHRCHRSSRDSTQHPSSIRTSSTGSTMTYLRAVALSHDHHPVMRFDFNLPTCSKHLETLSIVFKHKPSLKKLNFICRRMKMMILSHKNMKKLRQSQSSVRAFSIGSAVKLTTKKKTRSELLILEYQA